MTHKSWAAAVTGPAPPEAPVAIEVTFAATAAGHGACRDDGFRCIAATRGTDLKASARPKANTQTARLVAGKPSLE